MAFKLGTDPPVLEEEACWLEKLEVESNQMVNIGQQHGQKKKKRMAASNLTSALRHLDARV